MENEIFTIIATRIGSILASVILIYFFLWRKAKKEKNKKYQDKQLKNSIIMTNNIDFKNISQIAIKEVVEELKKEFDDKKINQVIETLDVVNMIAEVVQNTVKEMGLSPDKLGEEGIKEIAKASAKSAILEGIKKT